MIVPTQDGLFLTHSQVQAGGCFGAATADPHPPGTPSSICLFYHFQHVAPSSQRPSPAPAGKEGNRRGGEVSFLLGRNPGLAHVAVPRLPVSASWSGSPSFRESGKGAAALRSARAGPRAPKGAAFRAGCRSLRKPLLRDACLLPKFLLRKRASAREWRSGLDAFPRTATGAARRAPRPRGRFVRRPTLWPERPPRVQPAPPRLAATRQLVLNFGPVRASKMKWLFKLLCLG